MPEPLDLSESERSYLFGSRYDFAVYSTKFEAAKCFYDVRRLAEAQKAKLKGLGSAQFKKNHAVIRGNVIKSLTEAQYSQLLLPLATEDPTTSRLQHFVLGCYTLTPTLANRLTKCGLASSFPRLFRDAVGICSILPGTWEEVIPVLKQICEQNTSYESTALSAAIEAALAVPAATSPAATSPAATSPDAPSPNAPSPDAPSPDAPSPDAPSPDAPSEPATKRARFDIAVDGGKAGPLQFQPAWLDAAMNEDIDPNEIPDVEPRRMVMQMTDADTDRLQQLLQDSPLLDAIKTSRQWRWERKRDESSRPLRQRTNCIVALISGSSSHDISFVIKVGALAGWRINEYLEYDGSRNETLNET